MTRVTFILTGTLAFLLTGCVNVPMTTILVPTEHGTVTIKAPKDSKIAGLKANFEKGTVSLDTYETRMNPEVIGASALGQVELIRAYGDMANNLAQMGMKLMTTSQGIPLTAESSFGPTLPPAILTHEQLNTLIHKRAEEMVRHRTNAPALRR